MQINNNFNRFSASQPQFGMALKIKPGAEKFLKEQAADTFTRLNKIGEELADFKHFDLEVGEHGYAVRLKEDAEYIEPEYGTFFRDPRNPNAKGSFSYSDIDFKNTEEARMFYKEFEETDLLGRQVLVTKTLEDKYNQAQAKAKAFDKTFYDTAIQDLFERFGTRD